MVAGVAVSGVHKIFDFLVYFGQIIGEETLYGTDQFFFWGLCSGGFLKNRWDIKKN